ncbi:MAG: adenylosuccinate lyase [Clostridia bacterium]|nr:adenylosuccinate lyase [Clostridia bacterium]
MKNTYETPFTQRYSSAEMLTLFSPDTRYATWRRLWLALATAEQALGLPITDAQLDEMRAHLTDIDYDLVAAREREVKHDVMAHVYAYGKAAPSAAGIIHLGATSCYVTDNADLVIYRDALSLLRKELLSVIKVLWTFADRYKSTPTLGYTHYQPAQLVTVGKRATLWLQDLVTDLDDLEHLLGGLRFLGCRGTTGTEASFMELFEGDEKKIDEMNARIAADFGFSACFDVCGQTYPRKVDSRILKVLSGIAESATKFATDVRLLQHDGEVCEGFGEKQIGSSAMAYKSNPMHAERICSLARYLTTDALNGALTASTQWLERTLDDSANRRIAMGEGFLAADAILRLVQSEVEGLVVNEQRIEKHVKGYLPFIATENLLMEGVKRGGDRQALHEIIRQASLRAKQAIAAGETPDLLADLAKEGSFGMTEAEMERLLDPADYTGRAAAQTSAYLAKLRPIADGAEYLAAKIAL